MPFIEDGTWGWVFHFTHIGTCSIANALCNLMILIIEDFHTPAEKIRKILFPQKTFNKITRIDQKCFETLYELVDNIDSNFYVRLECFSDNQIDKLKFYFDQIYEVDGNLLKYLNKRKRVTKLYDISRENIGITDIREITENISTQFEEMDIGKSAKPYLNAQDEEEVVLYPSDEE